MDENTTAVYALIVSCIALFISLPLAWIQIAEYRRDRIRIEVFSAFTEDANKTAVLRLTNLSATTVIIRAWEFVWVRSLMHLDATYSSELKSSNELFLSIQSRTTETLYFENDKSYIWLKGEKEEDVLHLKLTISGVNSPLYVPVYQPKQSSVFEFLRKKE